jgi:hypothetical protein
LIRRVLREESVRLGQFASFGRKRIRVLAAARCLGRAVGLAAECAWVAWAGKRMSSWRRVFQGAAAGPSQARGARHGGKPGCDWRVIRTSAPIAGKPPNTAWAPRRQADGISLAESARVMHVKHRPCSQERPNRPDLLQAGGRQAGRFSSGDPRGCGSRRQGGAPPARRRGRRPALRQYSLTAMVAVLPAPGGQSSIAALDRVVTTRARAGSDDARNAAAGTDLPGAGASDDPT